MYGLKSRKLQAAEKASSQIKLYLKRCKFRLTKINTDLRGQTQKTHKYIYRYFSIKERKNKLKYLLVKFATTKKQQMI